MRVCVSFISFQQVWLAVLGIAALAALQHFPKKSISVMLHNPKKKKKMIGDWLLPLLDGKTLGLL